MRGRPARRRSARSRPRPICAGFHSVRAAEERLPADRNGAAMRYVRKVPRSGHASEMSARTFSINASFAAL